tara:strand:- start:1158 stop:3248 length:2091 start_codon:yes stop_codon:yes gene_type:complete
MIENNQFYNKIVNNSKLLFTIFIISIIILFVAIPIPKFNGNISGFNLENNQEFIKYNRTDSIFKNGSKIYLEILPNSDERKSTHKAIESLKQKIKLKYKNAKIISPLTFYSKMIRHWKIKNNKLSTFLKQAKQIPELNKLIANDLKSFLVVISFKDLNNIDIDYINNIVKSPPEKIKKINVFSRAHLESSIEKYITKDIRNLIILILAFFLVYITYTFRNYKALIFMAFTILGPIAVSIFTFYLIGVQINIISLLVFPIVLILALSDSIHLLTGYVKFNHVESKFLRAQKVISYYIIPSFFSSATTSAAFLSFYFFNESIYIQQFGLITSISLILEFIIIFTIAPFLLMQLDLVKINDSSLNVASNFLIKNKKPISFGLVLILMVSLFFVNKLSIKSDTGIFFPKNSEISNVKDRLIKNYYSTIELNILVSTHKEEINKKSLEDYIEKLSTKFKKEDLVINTSCALDKYYFKTRYGIEANLFDFFDQGNPYYDKKSNTYRIELRFKTPKDVVKFSDEKLTAILKDCPSGINIYYSSLGLLMDEVNNSITNSLIKSLLTSGFVIFLIILIITKSVLASFLSLLPNLIPIGFIIIIYYLLNININIITALTVVISIGLLDDDTVHILYRKFWLKKPMEELSFSILSSAIILTICFAFFMICSFKPIVTFGWVISLIFIIGVISEMTLMQWILKFFKEK